MEKSNYQKLVDGYLNKTLNKEELAVFFNLLENGELDDYVLADMDQFDTSKNEPLKKHKLRWLKYAAILIVSLSALLLYNKNFKSFSKNNVIVTPGYEHAVLTMADGTSIDLDTNSISELKLANGIVVSKEKQGELSYDISKVDKANKELTAQYSTITTPRGGMHKLVLSDGTKVWLNAASKLKFPLLFNNKNRVVEMEGEVYFAVMPNKKVPFIVKTSNQVVKVFGTEFNINAYTNESAIKTTLIEGSVSVSTTSATKLLLPNQQSENVNGQIIVNQADVKNVVAWKDGYFRFDKLTLKQLLKQVERWYDVEVVYDDILVNERFVGKLKRTANIQELLHIFNEGGIHAELVGRELHISKTVK